MEDADLREQCPYECDATTVASPSPTRRSPVSVLIGSVAPGPDRCVVLLSSGGGRLDASAVRAPQPQTVQWRHPGWARIRAPAAAAGSRHAELVLASC